MHDNVMNPFVAIDSISIASILHRIEFLSMEKGFNSFNVIGMELIFLRTISIQSHENGIFSFWTYSNESKRYNSKWTIYWTASAANNFSIFEME